MVFSRVEGLEHFLLLSEPHEPSRIEDGIQEIDACSRHMKTPGLGFL